MVSTLIRSELAEVPDRALVHVGLIESDERGVRQRNPTLDLLSVAGTAEGLDAVSPLLSRREGAIDVVIGIRPLWALLPVRYQRLVDGGLAEPFGTWVERLVDDHPHSGLDHVGLVSAWNERFGADRVRLVIDPTGVDRVAEVVADLAGTATVAGGPAEAGTGARSAATIEVRRRLNEAMTAPGSEVTPASIQLVDALLAELPGPGPDDAALSVPPSLMERLRPICEQAVARLGSGANTIVGELDDLLPPLHSSSTVGDDRPSLAIDDAAWLVHRLLLASAGQSSGVGPGASVPAP